MTEAQIDKIFELMSKCSSTTRSNIRSIYLARIGESIIGYCIKYFEQEKNADVRCDYLGFMLPYTRDNNLVTEFAIRALKDRSKQVRKKALSILAYSLDPQFFALLESIKGTLAGNESDIENAITAIQHQNHHLFYPVYNEWVISQEDKNRHLDKEKFNGDVKFYIEKHGKEVAPELKKILGSLYD